MIEQFKLKKIINLTAFIMWVNDMMRLFVQIMHSFLH